MPDKIFTTYRILRHLTQKPMSLGGSKRSKQGITLVEMMIYALVFVYCVTVFGNLLFVILNFWQSSRARKSIVVNAQIITGRITQDITKSYQVISPDSTQFSDSLVLVATDSGQITYSISEDQQLLRNGELVTDKQVSFSLDGLSLGFRKVGSSIDYRYLITSLHTPLAGTNASQLVKQTVFMENLK